MSEQPLVGALPSAVLATDSAERLTALFEAHGDRLYRLARRLTSTADEARDLVQDTYVRAACKLTSVPCRAPDEEAWLVRVMVNLSRDHWRKSAVRRRYADTAVAGQTSSDTESELIARTAVWQALDRLPPRRRAVVIMYELEGLTIAAIASLLGITQVTARWHLSKGRRDLARIITGERQ
jgi:RNA polymerase sigma-70 factor (ECF subfamily)